MRQDLETRQLRQIVTLARRGSFASAARALGLSQPALTRSIQAIEREVGAKLFDRHARGVSPTPVGELAVARAQQILAEVADLHREIDLLQGLASGVLRVGADMRSRVLPEALARLANRHPRLNVEVRLDHWNALARALLDREIDLMLAERSEAEIDGRFEVLSLPSEGGKWFVRPGHALLPRAGEGPVPMSALADHAVGLPSLPARLDEVFRPLLGPPARGQTRIIQCDDIQVLRMLAIHSDVVVLLSDSLAEEDVERGRLVELPVEGALPSTRPGVIWLRGRSLSPAGEAFLAALG